MEANSIRTVGSTRVARATPVIFGQRLASIGDSMSFWQTIALVLLWVVSYVTRVMYVLCVCFGVGWAVVASAQWRYTGLTSVAMVFVWKLCAGLVVPGDITEAVGVLVFFTSVVAALGRSSVVFLTRVAFGLGVFQAVWLVVGSCGFASVEGLGFWSRQPFMAVQRNSGAVAVPSLNVAKLGWGVRGKRTFPDNPSGFIPGKSKCIHCGFWVKPEGHAQRCRAPQSSEACDKLRRAAWLGDTLHTLDVRRALLAERCPTALLQIRASEYLDGKAQSGFYSGYSGRKMAAMGTSIHSLSSAFEASYVGEFRSVYVSKVLKAELEHDGGLEAQIVTVGDSLKLV